MAKEGTLMGIKIECDVEGCDETYSIPGDRMGRSVPNGWSRLEMSKEIKIDDDINELARRKARKMHGGLLYGGDPPPPDEKGDFLEGMGRGMPKKMHSNYSLLICSKHELPKFKEEAFDTDEFGYIPVS